MLKAAKRFFILLGGVAVIAFGIALIFLPGPAILVIPVGFLILATEFAWAKRIVSFARQRVAGWQTKT